ncbi:hypothetical protein [Methylomonas methanica]|uniref:Uncharacterized protein n=1 Tax=Methylomonas methanica (strain DSM 25384 / MC09) TaxID=857087 RepID=F9ZV47_METMM|nr:hypothetical protein [Methylomonas methanica]AEF99480.1 hypothetical protein Metme_1044 [Methylomonas methanica MC09]
MEPVTINDFKQFIEEIFPIVDFLLLSVGFAGFFFGVVVGAWLKREQVL